MDKVYIVGAGPGDPELLTVKAKKLISKADVIFYAGSLIPDSIISLSKGKTIKINTHGMKLEDIASGIEKYFREGKLVVRLSSGDPSIYGALRELLDALDGRKIPYEVVPGISSFLSAASRIKTEFTYPGGAQSVIITRVGGKTPVRKSESLFFYFLTGASIVLFLSKGLEDEILRFAKMAGISEETPIALLHKISMGDEKILEGRLADLKDLSKNIPGEGQTLIFIGDFLKNKGKRSYLYSGKTWNYEGIYKGELTIIPAIKDVITEVAGKIPNGYVLKSGSIRSRFKEAFSLGKPIYFVGSIGIATRCVSSLLKGKNIDPPIVCSDIGFHWFIPLLGGHRGANAISRKLARVFGGIPVVTTGTDVRGVKSLEDLSAERGFLIHHKTSTLKYNAKKIRRDRILSLGIGWRKGISKETLISEIESFIKEKKLNMNDICIISTIDEKISEAEKLLGFSRDNGISLCFAPGNLLNEFSNAISSPKAYLRFRVMGVSEPASLAVLEKGNLIIKKEKRKGFLTIAVAEEKWE